MKVLVNLTNLFNDQNIDGIGQYALNLLQGIQDIGEISSFHLIVTEGNCHFIHSMVPEAKMTIVPFSKYERLIKWKKNSLRFLYLDQLKVPKTIKKHKENILFHPYPALSIKVSSVFPTVVTLHDLLFHNFPAEVSPLKKIWCTQTHNSIIHKTSHLIVPSRFVKNDVMKHYQEVDEKKITVIPNPVRVNREATTPFPVNEPFILSVNSLRLHKNLKTLIEAYAKIEDQIPHRLVLTGFAEKIGESSITNCIRENNVKKILLTGYIASPERNFLYKNASLFVSPSLHEGFGMTPIEAALFEAPVLTTRETSIPEATLDLLNYYQPADDPNRLAEKMLSLLKYPPPAEKLKEIKEKYSQSYNYKKIARQYCNFFQNAFSQIKNSSDFAKDSPRRKQRT